MRKMPAIIGQQFAYAYGRIGTLAHLLLSSAEVDRLLGAHGRKETEKILTELAMTSRLPETPASAEAILQALEGWVRETVEHMTPENHRPTFTILWLAGDAPWMSYLLKKHHRCTAAESIEPQPGMTAYDPEDIRACIEERVSGSLPTHVTEFIAETKALSAPTPQDIDSAVAKFIARTQMRLAKASGSKAILHFVQTKVAMANVRTQLRNAEEDVRENAMLPEAAPVQYTIREAIDRTKGDLVTRERICAEATAETIRELHNVPLGIEPVFAFAATALSQLALLRAILNGKSGSLSPQEIKSMIPPFLSASHYAA